MLNLKFVNNLKLRNKILIPVILITAIAILLISMAISIVGGRYIKSEKENEIKILSRQYSGKVEQQIENVMKATETIASISEGMKRSGLVDRKNYTNNLKRVLENSPDFIFGVWYVWEPNAFDGKDNIYVNTTGHDSTGRFIPYWNRGKGGIDLEPNMDYVSNDENNYYNLPKLKNSEVLTEPTEFVISGKKTTVVSAEVPIKDKDGKFIALVGMDLTIDNIVKMINEIKPYGVGYAYLISNKGTIVSHPNVKNIGKGINETDKEFEKKYDVMKNIKLGKEIIIERKESYGVITPITIGSTNAQWAIGIEIPKKIVKEQVNKVNIILLIAFIISILVMFLVVRVLAGKITKPLEEFVEIFEKGAMGDLTVRVNEVGKDEIGVMSREFNEFMNQIENMIKNIKEGATSVKNSAIEINKSNENLANKATNQASALEEISSTMEEISSTVSSNVVTIDEISKVIKTTRGKTEIAGDVSESLKKSMHQISESSKKIRNIIDVIDEIAFQTNLLALNAAVEAARAGEQGRGFAVVAVEVRNLAARSSKAAKEIKELIKESGERVDSGTDLVDTAIDSLESIIEDVIRINEVMSNISVSAAEQKNGIEQVNKAIADLDEITQTNAGIAEETSATSHILDEKAGEFMNIVESFKISEKEKGIGLIRKNR